MDMFTRFNHRAIEDRQMDTLIGLSKGIVADGAVNQAEAEALLTWLVQSRNAVDHPVVANLLERVSVMLRDHVLQLDESAELLAILRRFVGEPSAVGELAKTTQLPIDDPTPLIAFPEHSFAFTGTCAYGTRKQCQDATAQLGGTIASGITKSVDYLVLGTYVTDSWAHETYGRKIEKAMQYRESGVPIAIISEAHWADAGNLQRASGPA